MGGTAIFRASEEIVGKGIPIAASMLEAAEEDISFAEGAFSVTGTDRRVALLDVAARRLGRRGRDWTRITSGRGST